MKTITQGRARLFIRGLFADAGVSHEHRTPLRNKIGVLSRLLARANRVPDPHSGYEHRLFALFGIDPSASADLPVAAVTRIADMGVVDREWWMRADPVHLAPTRNGLVLRASLGLSQSESDRLVAEINQALGSDGWLLKAPSPERWYLKPVGAVRISTTPLASVVGRDIQSYMPMGDDSRLWNTHLNEIQILLHTAQVNTEREKRGVLPANSVWFWGGGSLPNLGKSDWSHVIADDVLARGLARLSSISCTSISSGVDVALDEAAEGNVLIVLDVSPQAGMPDAHDASTETLVRIEQGWLNPLKDAVERGVLTELIIHSDDGTEYRYRRWHRLRFWRRPRPIAAYRAA